MNEDVTVTITHEEWVQLTNLLQLITVLGVRLYMQGIPHPNVPALTTAFGKLTLAGFDRKVS